MRPSCTLFILFFLFVAFSAPAQIDTAYYNSLIQKFSTNLNDDIESSEKYLMKADSYAIHSGYISGQVFNYYYKAVIWGRKREYEKAIQLAQHGLYRARKEGMKRSSANFMRLMGIHHQKLNNLDSARANYSGVLQLAIKMNDSTLMSNTYHSLATLSEIQHKYQEAITYFVECLKIDRALNQEKQAVGTMNNLAILMKKVGNYSRALAYITESEAIAENNNWVRNLMMAKATKAGIFKEQKEYDQSYRIYEQALGLAKKIHDNGSVFIIYKNLANVLYEMNNLDGALINCDSAMQYAKGKTDTIFIETIQLRVSNKKNKHFRQYETLLKESKTILVKTEPVEYYRLCGQTYAQHGEYVKAINSLNKAMVISDSLNNLRKTQTTAEAEARFHVEKVDFENKSLIKDQALKQAQISRQKSLLLAIGAGFLAILLTAIFFYTIARQRKKNNEILNGKNDELALQKERIELLNRELVHRSNSNLNLIHSLINLQKEQLQGLSTEEILDVNSRRIQTLASVQRHLSNKEKGRTDYSVVINSLSQDLLLGHVPSVELITDLHSFPLHPEQLTYVSLIVNELITNSIKYAFEGQSEPKITLNGEKQNGKLTIEYQDNGKGSTGEIKGSGKGMELINLFVQQLKGRSEQRQDNGYFFKFEFPINT